MRLIAALIWTSLALPAFAQTMSPGQGPLTALFVTGAVSGNGADLTEDTATTCVYNLPANMLANVGDRIRFVAAGSAIGSTDNKVVRLRIGPGAGGIINSNTINTASGTRWAFTADTVKTGASTQTTATNATVLNSASTNGTNVILSTVTDTAIIPVSITLQNSTNSTLNSLTCGYLSVDLIRAPSS